MNNHINILPKRAKFYLKSSKTRCGSLRRSPRPPNREGTPTRNYCLLHWMILSLTFVSVTFCPYPNHYVHTNLSNTILSVYHCVLTILSVYHFVRTILS